MTDNNEEIPLHYTDEAWWLMPFKERDTDNLATLYSIVDARDFDWDLIDYFDDDYDGELPDWLMQRMDRFELFSLLTTGEGSHGMYYGLHAIWDKEQNVGALIESNTDEKYAPKDFFFQDQSSDMSASITLRLREMFEHCEPTDKGAQQLNDSIFFDPEHLFSGIDDELKDLVYHLYAVTEGGLMRDKWPTADDWINEALAS